MNHRKRIAFVAVLLSCVLFFASLAFPAFYLESEHHPEYPSLAIHFLGWMGVPSASGGDYTYVPWLANPLLFLSLVLAMAGNRQGPLVSSTAAFALGLASCRVKSVLIDAAGNTPKVVGYGAGFYFWLSALGVCFVA